MVRKLWINFSLVLVFFAALALFLRFISPSAPLMEETLIFVLIGFAAQLVDGAIGMAYGVLSNSFLLTMGVHPAFASASIHTSRIFTSLASGIAHLRLGNVSKQLLKQLIIPGMVGGVIGAYLLSSAPVEPIRIIVNAYLLMVGVVIIANSIRSKRRKNIRMRYVGLVGALGGFIDSVGGGGWGPVVTSTLIADGHNPRLAIGSASLTKFLVTIVQSATFMILLQVIRWSIVVGLTLGGLLASPLSAHLCKKLPTRVLMMLAGLIVVFLGIRNLII